MPIVDAQVHIWGANTPSRPWPVAPAGLKAVPAHKDVPFTKDYLLGEMARAGVDRVVIIPPSWEGDRNDLAVEAAQLHPDRFGVMGRLDFEAPDAREQVAAWRGQPGMLGLRFTFQTPLLEKPLLDGRVDWAWAEAEKARVPIMVVLTPSLLPIVDRVAERHPGLRLVIDHLALVSKKKDEQAFAHLDQLLALAKRPNIAVKATSLPSYTNEPYPFRGLHAYLRRVYDAFGPKRVFWGSDLSRLPCSYRQAVTMITEEVAWLTEEDKEWIMGRGVSDWLWWNA